MSSREDSLPTTVIRARRGWAGFGIAEVVERHELLYFLVWRDLKVRYKQTAFGIAWAVLQPLLMMGVLSIFLGQLSGIRPAAIPYPLFVLAGLVPWTLFAQGVGAAGNSLVESAALLTKVYFPRLIFPFAAVGSHAVDFVIGLGLLAVIAMLFGFAPTVTWLALVPLSMLALASALAVGLWLAALNVRYRDFRYAIPFLIQVWFFATPIAYGMEAVPTSIQGLVALNPMAGVVVGFRWAITGATDPPSVLIAVSAIATSLLLVAGLAYFRRVERTFADII